MRLTVKVLKYYTYLNTCGNSHYLIPRKSYFMRDSVTLNGTPRGKV